MAFMYSRRTLLAPRVGLALTPRRQIGYTRNIPAVNNQLVFGLQNKGGGSAPYPRVAAHDTRPKPRNSDTPST
jgi:hypothetical protein